MNFKLESSFCIHKNTFMCPYLLEIMMQVVIGGSNLDVVAKSRDSCLAAKGPSNKASICISSGGVGRNVAGITKFAINTIVNFFFSFV